MNLNNVTRVKSKKRLAIVIPFVFNQLGLLEFQLQYLWENFPPCLSPVVSQPVDLIFHNANSIQDGRNSHQLDQLNSILTYNYSWLSCFQEILYIESDIPRQLNVHPEGTCYMFFQLFATLKERYLYFQIIEPDVSPFRKDVGWINQILRISFDANDFWVKGSISVCPKGTAWKDYHINGNALYKLGDPLFEEYLQKVKQYYSRRTNRLVSNGCSGTFYGGYDVSIFQYLYACQSFEEWEYVQQIIHKFSYDTTVLNYCGNVPFNIENIRKRYPKTVLIHSKWFILTSKHQIHFNKSTE
eukprot:jgi/Galph1/5570/GphlegSOOS_G4298.1